MAEAQNFGSSMPFPRPCHPPHPAHPYPLATTVGWVSLALATRYPPLTRLPLNAPPMIAKPAKQAGASHPQTPAHSPLGKRPQHRRLFPKHLPRQRHLSLQLQTRLHNLNPIHQLNSLIILLHPTPPPLSPHRPHAYPRMPHQSLRRHPNLSIHAHRLIPSVIYYFTVNFLRSDKENYYQNSNYFVQKYGYCRF